MNEARRGDNEDHARPRRRLVITIAALLAALLLIGTAAFLQHRQRTVAIGPVAGSAAAPVSSTSSTDATDASSAADGTASPVSVTASATSSSGPGEPGAESPAATSGNDPSSNQGTTSNPEPQQRPPATHPGPAAPPAPGGAQPATNVPPATQPAPAPATTTQAPASQDFATVDSCVYDKASDTTILTGHAYANGERRVYFRIGTFPAKLSQRPVRGPTDLSYSVAGSHGALGCTAWLA